MTKFKFIAMSQFLLMLCGCNIGGTIFSDRVSVDDLPRDANCKAPTHRINPRRVVAASP